MPTTRALAHIPGPPCPPVIGHTLGILRDSYGTQLQYIDRYGPVYKTKMLGVWRINLCGADALEMVLLDRDKVFSSEGGWDALSRIFSGGLLMQDGEAHRANRRILQSAFRAPALRDYLTKMNAAMGALIEEWPLDRPFDFYEAIKTLTLKIGCSVFMGLDADGRLARDLNRAFVHEIAATLAPIRSPLPFTAMGRGVAARKFLRETFRQLIPARRAAPGEDFFSQMCVATNEDGQGWSEDQILDQFNLLMMAAHDSTSTALTAMIAGLAEHPLWQERLATEVASLGTGPLQDTDLAAMTQTDLVIREALRMVPPVPFIPRLATRDFEWQGYIIPKGSSVTVNPGVTMLSPQLYTDPTRFDPLRFAPDRAEDKRHKFAWTPFGGGAHKCIGMHFSTMQMKLFTATLLRKRRVALTGGAPQWQRMPIPKPKGGLKVLLRSA